MTLLAIKMLYCFGLLADSAAVGAVFKDTLFLVFLASTECGTLASALNSLKFCNWLDHGLVPAVPLSAIR